ncbi:MAG: N-6 DNA methylase [Elusimicrobia bacterium]|nr:N-6 DNA methylase [Candidatus Liberimonas magnetica]
MQTAKQMDNDLKSTGRQSNKNLSFRLYGKSKHQQYYTPNELADCICKMLLPAFDVENIGYLSVLDPTCGSGRLLLPWKNVKAQVLGIELDKEIAVVAKRLIGKENVRTGDLLDYASLLNGFNLAVSNPPYGIRWDVKDKSVSFEATSYGESIESQSATIEIITQALGYNGILAAIIPATTFTNAKDSGLRKHLYSNYDVLLKATLKNVFKAEYNIDVVVDLVIAQKSYVRDEKEKADYEKLEIDIIKDFGWQNTLISAMKKIIEDKKIEVMSSKSGHVPFLNMLEPVETENKANITCRGISGNVSTIALLNFINKTVEDYNVIQGVQTGIVDAYLSSANLIKRGIKPAMEMLKHLGFNAEAKKEDIDRLERLKEKYEFLSMPIYKPKSHQLLAYFYDKEYEAKETVKDKENRVLFKEGKKYHLHPSWVRRKELAKLDNVYDEQSKKNFTIKTEIDRGYLSINVISEQGQKTFREIDLEDIKTFIKVFPLPDVEDVNDKYPKLVESYRKRIESEFPFLFDYQKEDLARLALKNFGYVGYEMGGGKTVTSVCWAKLRNYKHVLIVCQSGLVDNWLNELNKFGFKVQKLTTHSSVDKLKEQKRADQKTGETIYYITSYEFLSLESGKRYDPWDCIEYDKDGNIRRKSTDNKSEKCPLCHRSFSDAIKECPKCKEHEKWTGNVCLKCGYVAYTYTSERKSYPAYKRIRKMFDAVIVDEAQMAKTKNSLRGRAVRALKPKGKLILTGTLMKGYITDIYWNVGWLLGFGNPLFPYNYVGGSKYFLNEFGTFEFVTKQFEDTLSEGRARLIPEVSNLNRFWRIIASFAVRRLKDEMIELPKKNKNILLLPMHQEHADVYNQFQEWATKTIKKAMNMAERNGGEVNMGVISSALWKLRFAATVPNARDYLCDGKGPDAVLSNGSWNKVNKIVELAEQIKQRNEKVIIFSALRPMVSAICKKLRDKGIEFIPILSNHKSSQRFAKIEEFSANGHTAIVTGLNVLNRGFTITAANNVIISDIEYTPESTLQAEDRAHRTGQQKEVNVYYLFSKGSIDELMFELVSKKQAAISNAIDGKAAYSNLAELLEGMKGNIQMEVAKRITVNKPVEAEKNVIPVALTITTDYKEPANNLWNELYKAQLEMLKNKRAEKRKKVLEHLAQPTLFDQMNS